MTDRIEEIRRQAEALQQKIKTLNETVWKGRVSGVTLQEWLENFTGEVEDVETERFHSLYLLSHMTFFGEAEVRELLRALYRDQFRYPIVKAFRKRNGDTRDSAFLEALFEEELLRTRFVAVGRPSESGHMLTYPFRQMNNLSIDHFTASDRIVVRRRKRSAWNKILEAVFPSKYLKLRRDTIRRYVFLDDFAGTGHQARQYTLARVREIKRLDPNIDVHYLVLAATSEALSYLRSRVPFDSVDAALILQPDDRCTSPKARIFQKVPRHISQATALKIARAYGAKLVTPADSLGYGGGGWLIGFNHNVPDNTLPIIWYPDPKTWRAVFPRHKKS